MKINLHSNSPIRNIQIIGCCIVILICCTYLIILSILMLLNDSNDRAYEEYSTSSDIRKVEVEITNIKKCLINKNKNTMVMGYKYYVKFIVNNVEYKEKFSNPKKILEIGDKTIKEVYKDKKGNYKFPKFTSKEEKDNAHNNNLGLAAIVIGMVTALFILGLLTILNSKDTKEDGSIPVTKNNIIYIKISICLVTGFFLTLGVLGLLGNFKFFLTEAKIVSINQENKMIQGNNSIQFNYQIEYTIDNIKYHETISEPWDSIKPLQIGDTKTVIIRTNILKENYKYVTGDYLKLSEQSKRGYILFIVLICFSTFSGYAMLKGFDKSIEE